MGVCIRAHVHMDTLKGRLLEMALNGITLN